MLGIWVYRTDGRREGNRWRARRKGKRSSAHGHAAVGPKARRQAHVHAQELVLVVHAFHARREAQAHGVRVHHDDRGPPAVGRRRHVLEMGRELLVLVLVLVRPEVLVARLVHVLAGSRPCLSLSLRLRLRLCLRLSLSLRMGVSLDVGLCLGLRHVDLGLHVRLELLGMVHGRRLERHAVLLVLLLVWMLVLLVLMLLLLLLLLLVMVLRRLLLVVVRCVMLVHDFNLCMRVLVQAVSAVVIVIVALCIHVIADRAARHS